MVDRERGLDRTRVRPNTHGNFITLVKGGNLYALVYPKTAEPPKKYELYSSPFPAAFGYKNEPLDPFPLVLIGPAVDPQSVVPLDIITIDSVAQLPVISQPQIPAQPVIVPQPIDTSILPSGVAPQQAQPFKAGDAFQVLTATTPKQLVPGPIPCKQVALKAHNDNTGDIWIGFRQNVAVNDGIMFRAGSGEFINIDDLSRIFFIGSAAGDKLQVQYFV